MAAMALSRVSLTKPCILRPSTHQIPANLCNFRPNIHSFSAKRSFMVQSAAESSSEVTVESTSETPAETSRKSPSLISAVNVEKALRGIAITDVDHYGRLGIARGTPYDRVTVAYKEKCEDLRSQGLDEEETDKELELLKESYAILSSEEERRLYDWSLARSENPGRYVWPFEVDITQASNIPPPPKEPEDTGPTKLVGYFFIGWLVLSFAMSIALH
ncbi:hypothetical protein AMTRI_Chr04g180340 [Amborella trichopoda]|uniref:J domain-containing protein n=1 Tax=Amborella trichopoda TaxID=13333 RepID=W1PU64_AMBTC|nr:NAD(P)H-quinone oxidoreductase subunit U, chloroplastic isoform X2 [Amborella trichopoda]XP_020526099.1 NAD(P)H-quinone oxidoreductase subunit U, chloroplastic isoform X2 [Amborella trichopoda]ERN11216.1 hypothetical protein AMTR_s00024p00220440 [Amborella trichopoda]|eukprot:XP_006849635.1 NAD(P)H-quinone oxidoreductase subunit U, chloroplastic isoform X2 [Amborella trichopoda]